MYNERFTGKNSPPPSPKNIIAAVMIVITITVELGYYVMKGNENFLSLETGVVITEECNIMINSEELISTTGYVTL